ncbi:hypothetical protein Nhal_1886 [Nitrosococcus halophilus Nc 4]|uniref:Uncharacterized protein n=1 Tax=Nitrosococcus halophilus (strain Nc4) TaxID=472759 RepID=D5C3M7_NITHN|nr:hypothetical protein Nhal_1886 [Nitrosococcus halophilus Nc 4]
MNIYVRLIICLGIIVLQYVALFLPLTELFLIYILLFNPRWFREFLNNLDKNRSREADNHVKQND